MYFILPRQFLEHAKTSHALFSSEEALYQNLNKSKISDKTNFLCNLILLISSYSSSSVPLTRAHNPRPWQARHAPGDHYLLLIANYLLLINYLLLHIILFCEFYFLSLISYIFLFFLSVPWARAHHPGEDHPSAGPAFPRRYSYIFFI